MRRKIGTLGVCGALLFSFGAPVASGVAAPSAKAGCKKLSKKYFKAVEAGHARKAGKIRQKMVNKGCQNLPPPATPTVG